MFQFSELVFARRNVYPLSLQKPCNFVVSREKLIDLAGILLIGAENILPSGRMRAGDQFRLTYQQHLYIQKYRLVTMVDTYV